LTGARHSAGPQIDLAAFAPNVPSDL
jgi:hypothetical protein